jgi:hypothetical protein
MKVLKLFLVSSIVATALLADQFAYIKPGLADRAARLLKKEKDVLFLCEPCGEFQGKIIPLTTVEEIDVNYEGQHEVKINNEGIDLAYTYVRRGKGWRNLAVELGLSPSGVSSNVGADGAGKPRVEEDR